MPEQKKQPCPYGETDDSLSLHRHGVIFKDYSWHLLRASEMKLLHILVESYTGKSKILNNQFIPRIYRKTTYVNLDKTRNNSLIGVQQ